MFEFRLPDIGEGVVEGEVVKWHVKEGDNVREDQPMVEVMTDKATVEIPSPQGGRGQGDPRGRGSDLPGRRGDGRDRGERRAGGRRSDGEGSRRRTAKEERQFLDKTPKSEPASVSAQTSNVIAMSRATRRQGAGDAGDAQAGARSRRRSVVGARDRAERARHAR